MKRLLGALFVISVFIMGINCALRKTTKPATVSKEPQATSAAPDTTKSKSQEEPVIIFEEVPTEQKPVEQAAQPQEEKSVKPAQVYGYRVQVMAALKEENANRLAEELRSKIDKPVYIEYIAPYYKVRVGDFLSREEAERFRDTLRSMGYYDAFIVETLINSP